MRPTNPIRPLKATTDPVSNADAAKMTREDRSRAETLNLSPLPGLAEVIDLLRAVSDGLGRNIDPEKTMERCRPYILQKHPDLRAP